MSELSTSLKSVAIEQLDTLSAYWYTKSSHDVSNMTDVQIAALENFLDHHNFEYTKLAKGSVESPVFQAGEDSMAIKNKKVLSYTLLT